MSTKRTRILNEIPIKSYAKGANQLTVKLFYEEGGMNYFTGTPQTRGIYLSVCPVEKKEGSTVYTAFTGTKMLLDPWKRFNAKKFDTFEPDADTVKKLIDHVCATENIQI